VNKPFLASRVLTLLLLLVACKRSEGASTADAATSTPPNGAASPALVAAAPQAVPARPAGPAVDPRWPQWMPPIAGITVRMAMREALEGYADRPSLLLLIDSRRACETAGYTLSATTTQRTQWDSKFIFTATRGAELIRVELTGQSARPNFTSFNATTGAFAQTMMRRRR